MPSWSSHDHDGVPASAPRPPHVRRKGDKKKRQVTACQNCRQRKLKCDLGNPCASCYRRGEGAQCSLWDGISPPSCAPPSPSELKALVDRLETTILDIHSKVGGGFLKPAATHQDVVEVYPRADALPEIASRLVFAVQDSKALEDGGCAAILTDIYLREPGLASSGAPSTCGPQSFFAPIPSTFSHSTPFQLLPNRIQAGALVSSYLAHAFPFPFIDPVGYFAECEAVWMSLDRADPHWLASFLVIAAIGLAAMSKEDVTALGLTNRGPGESPAQVWIEHAVWLLKFSDYTCKPSLDAFRAILLLNVFWLGQGNTCDLRHLATVNATLVGPFFSLGLSRGRSKYATFDAREAEDRRRLFYGFVGLDAILRALSGRTYALLDSSATSVVPVAPAPESFQEAVHGVVHRTITILNEITASYLRSTPNPTPYDRILAWHGALSDIQLALTTLGAHADTSSAWILLAFTFVQLHRPLTLPDIGGAYAIDTAWHRGVMRHYARTMLNLQRTLMLVPTSASLTLCASGSVALATDVIQYDGDEAEAQRRRQELFDILHLSDSLPVDCQSLVLRRSISVIKAFMLRAVPTEAQPAFDTSSGSSSGGSSGGSSVPGSPDPFRGLPPGQDSTLTAPSSHASFDLLRDDVVPFETNLCQGLFLENLPASFFNPSDFNALLTY